MHWSGGMSLSLTRKRCLRSTCQVQPGTNRPPPHRSLTAQLFQLCRLIDSVDCLGRCRLFKSVGCLTTAGIFDIQFNIEFFYHVLSAGCSEVVQAHVWTEALALATVATRQAQNHPGANARPGAAPRQPSGISGPPSAAGDLQSSCCLQFWPGL